MAATKPTSLARIAANRRNCQLSTGPKTAEGKARARANAVKHGLTGAGVALPTEDVAAIEALCLDMQEQFCPQTVLGAELVHQMAMLTVRKHRAKRAEAAHLRGRVRRAGADFDRARTQRVGQLLDAIESQPRACREYLCELPEGIDRLVAALLDLRADLATEVIWTPEHHRRLDALFGFRANDFPRNRPTRYSRVILGDPGGLIPSDEVAEDPNERIDWAVAMMLAAIDAEVAALVEHHATLDRDGLAEDRLDAIGEAEVDASPDAERARRYAAAASRELSQTLRDFHLAEALAAPPEPEPLVEQPAPHAVPADPNPQPGNDIEPPLASFGNSAAEPAAAPDQLPLTATWAAVLADPTPVFTPIRR